MMMRIDLVGWALLMIALAMSFSVLHKAAKDTDKKLKLLGNVIGIIILVACLVLAIGDLSSRIRTRRPGTVMPRRAGETRQSVTPSRVAPTLPKIPTAPRTAVPVIPAPPK
ncbi:MAG: hypothetical protein KKD29_06795 [Candidatus Omnitrophica bacterium]|nr:hypothetical protein [Candidatus Omnitrophota bacterium]MBU4487919.1 hypothetical protein [Candidatus Omnitrophota bacterium]MCG2705626.1 hypothetical protein [Candidatus Omnitrophota bacterium]